MARVVGLYALVFVFIFSVLSFTMTAIGLGKGGAVLTFIARPISNSPSNIGDLYLLDLATYQTVHLPICYTYIINYAWSPNGSMIACTVTHPDELPAIDIYTSRNDRIASLGNGYNIYSPNWMPDNQTLAFTAWTGLFPQIYFSSIDNPQDWQLFKELTQDPQQWVFSPDGKSFAVVHYAPNGNSDLSLFNINSNEMNVIAYSSDNPAWSPDSQRIAYTSSENTGNSHIRVIHLSDYLIYNLDNGVSNSSQPAWSPDGTQIAFVSDRDGDSEIFIMNADGTNVRQVTFNDVNDSQPAWMP